MVLQQWHMVAVRGVVLQQRHLDSVYSVLQQRGHMDSGINSKGRDAFELGDDRGDSTEILGSTGLCIGGSYRYMVVQTADEEAEGQCH